MPAGIALLHMLHMAAQGRRPAVANRRESLALPAAENMAPLREEVVLVPAKHIGHFGPMSVHRFGGITLALRTRSSGPRVSSGLRVERTVVSARCR